VQDLPRPKQPEVWSYEWGLKADEKEMIKDQMFGLNTAATGVVENESMRRIFPSTIGMMFPQLGKHSNIFRLKNGSLDD